MKRVTAWTLAAELNTGGVFTARRVGGRVIWTDARFPRGRNDGESDVVVIGRIEPAGEFLRVIEQRVPADAPFELLTVADPDSDLGIDLIPVPDDG